MMMSERRPTPVRNYLYQLSAAEREMRRFYDDLRESGWRRSPSGVWTHPDKPGIEIMEG